MAAVKKPTQAEIRAAEIAVEQVRRDTNLDRDLKDIGKRLENIESGIRDIHAAELVSKVVLLEARITKLENNQTSVVRLVLGTVGAALLATVVGIQLK